MSSEMVERVAAAIQGADNDTDWDYQKMARAAIEAMREPTSRMFEAECGTTLSYGDERSSFEYVSANDAANLWRDMIDLALKK